ncbi:MULTISPECIES: hypothetical protein [Mesorhizobium]|uniref:hypothetical protein n=1 Tax=Mesorhizobium TaxID=68287 RepID=UPI0019D4A0EA|nr:MULTISPECIES: hypothetical protein [Mesorhizobium]MCF6098516.1 hypothetical protein [Mesorhizobium muleiense]
MDIQRALKLYHHCNTDAEKADIKAGKIPASGKTSPPSCARRTGTRLKLDGEVLEGQGSRGWKAQQCDIAIRAFGYKNHAAIDRRHGLIRG